MDEHGSLHVATIELTKDTFDDVIQNNELVIIDFWAPWCGPCKSFAPIFEAASEKHPDVVFGKVNTDEEQELGATFQIRSIPTLMILRDQIVLFSQPGMLSAGQLDEVLAKAKELDMDMVRSEIAKQQAAEAKDEPAS